METIDVGKLKILPFEFYIPNVRMGIESVERADIESAPTGVWD